MTANRLRPGRARLIGLIAAASFALLAGCDTAEERAERHFQSGLELLQAGDVERALVEFRNVFKLNGSHREARLAYAKVERDRGNLQAAYGQYLRVVEQYPDDFEALLALAEIASQGGEWQEADRHAAAALALQPDNVDVQIVRAVADYGLAKEKATGADTAPIVERVRKLRAERPENLLLFGVLIDDAVLQQDYPAALANIDDALKIAPKDRGLYALRLSVLAAQNDDAGVEAGLRDMAALFPGDPAIGDALIRWYVGRNEIDKAETFLRERAGAPDAAASDAAAQVQTLELIRFLAEYRGADAAIAELDARIAAGQGLLAYRSTRAGLRFDLGLREEAIAEMEEILAGAPPGDDARKVRIGLARMLIATGNDVGARALVEEVLAEDSGNVEGLKLKANWLILGDEVGEAINVLRRALDDHPDDASIMSLMALAYERDGNGPLMREMMSLAVEASGRAPAESLRYAQVLMGDRNFGAAESVLIDSLRLAPGTPELLLALGQVYLEMQDWPRASDVARALDEIGSEETKTASAAIQASILEGQQRTDEAITYLRTLAEKGEGGLAPRIAIIRAHLSNGQNDEARAYAAALLEESPEDPSLRFINASVLAATGEAAQAEATFRDLVAEDPARTEVWMSLFRILAADPARRDEAGAALDTALAAVPDNPELLWAKAGFLEQAGDLDGAIGIYEALYARDSTNTIIANNLASLLSTHRTDEQSLARAEVIARRLRDSDIAAFQDTYGWIAFRRGNVGEALPVLEKAAEVLTDDPQVQYHLARAYLASGRDADALAQFQRVIDLAGDGDTRPFVTESRTEAARLAGTAGSAGN